MTAAVVGLRPMQTAFDPEDGPLTLATPSCCCCCCCCCISTVASAVMFDARDGYLKGERTGRAALGTLIGLTALPITLAIGTLLGVTLNLDDSALTWAAPMIAIYMGLIYLMHRVGNVAKGIINGMVRVVFIGGALVAEVFLVLITTGIFWLATPLFMWLAWTWASSLDGGQPRRPT